MASENKFSKETIEIASAWTSGCNEYTSGNFQMYIDDFDGEDATYIIHLPTGKKTMICYTEGGTWGWWTKSELENFVRKCEPRA